MAAAQPARNHSLHLGHTLALVTIALALALGVFAARAAVSLAQARIR